MPWQQLNLAAGDQDPEQLSAFFEQQGAVSVTFVDAADQPLFEPEPGTTPLWSATAISALFAADADTAAVGRRLAALFGAAVLERLQVSTLQDRDWERAWLDRFQPMRFGHRLWICPAGKCPPQDAANVLIDLDPGLAFGTGSHATTALCLEWLDRHAPAQQQVLDYGCGSGILAIAALKLGARSAWAVDIDPQALWSSRENATRNGVAGRLKTARPDELPAGSFDLLLANILANPLIELAPRLAVRVRKGGDLVLSGILRDQVDAVRAAYAEWFSFTGTVAREDWVRLHAVRQ